MLSQADGSTVMSHPRSPTGPAPSDIDWLAGMLSLLRDEGLPTPTSPELPPLVNRNWSPSTGPREALPNAVILRRHPELTFALVDLPAFRVMRHRVPYGRGIKKEFASQITDRDVFAYSSLEFDALREQELDGSVDNYIEQPLLLRYELDGKLRFAKPDILVLQAGELRCFEVKFEADARQHETKWSAIGKALASLGLGYSVLTERHIRREPFFQNAKIVFARRHCRPPRAAALDALEAVRAAGRLTITDLGPRFGIAFDETCFLLRHGLLSADLAAARLGPNTEVRWSSRCRVDPWQVRE